MYHYQMSVAPSRASGDVVKEEKRFEDLKKMTWKGV